ncbi:hypothetical protein [Flagellimonas olearia]|nr:hypothetical protein [Allomuricauda olearia]
MITRNSIAVLLLILSLMSCDFFKSQDRPQGYPDYDFSLLEKVVYFDMETEEQLFIDDISTIETVKEYFQDKGNYFKDELRKFNGVKPNFSLTLISSMDTLVLRSYPQSGLKGRIEFDFTEKYDPNHPMKPRKVHRFYIKSELLDLLGM